ncbi:MAG: Gfo/Idh/MocA family oxidoreductase [Bacteroidales bacterium]|nr:Gfo/Idh/MocA family oxidoreductase [Bacteroidales bacterium]
MKTYNWGILGTGFIARKMAEALLFVPQSKLYAVGSRNMDTAKAFAGQYNVEKGYDSYDALARDPNIDIVYIATPHNLHYENTMMSLDHGKHVLCEKPFAVNGREVRAMINMAMEKNCFLMEAMWTRFLPGLIKVKELVDSGRIGRIRLLTADFGIHLPFDPNHRLYNKKLIGGSLLDLGIYPLFLSLLLLGKPKNSKAMAGMGTTGVDHNCSFTLGYDNDTLAVLYSSIVAKTDIMASIYGENGTIVFDNWWYMPVPVKLITPDGKEEYLNRKSVGNGYNYEATELIQCLEKGKIQSDLMSWENSLLLIDTLDAIRKEIGLVYEGHDDVLWLKPGEQRFL